MSIAVIEFEGVEVEIAGHGVCDRSGAHRELVSAARLERRALGHDVENSAVLCMRCLKAVPLKN
jgi:hypothetical protein